MFQSALAVQEISQLNYGDVQDEIESGILPICLQVVRQKTGTPFKTFLGRDAVKYLRLYLETRNNLKRNSPLFTLWGSPKRITPQAIQQRFSLISEELSFIKKEDLAKGYSPARPHSLRSGFRSRLTGKISDDLIEFWMGHTLSGTKGAYYQ
jgi:integrase